jgi:aromatic ring-opening dioxygenase LigB subunit
MTIVGAFILPHGSMVLEPAKSKQQEEVVGLYNGMKKAALAIEELQPDIIFFTSPHGLATTDQFAIYLNHAGKGSAEWQGEYIDYIVEVDFADSLASQLYDFLSDRQLPVTGLTAFSAAVPAPFRWGEAVPLWFLRNLSSEPKYLYLSQPTKRLTETEKLIPITLKLGAEIGKFFDRLGERVVIIISADLAHTHDEKGPYGYAKEATAFDLLIEQWVTTFDKKLLIDEAPKTLSEALCCGFIGFVLLQGILDKKKFKPKLINRQSPTYYGMLISSFLPK